jgi:hypothetical protein
MPIVYPSKNRPLSIFGEKKSLKDFPIKKVIQASLMGRKMKKIIFLFSISIIALP